MYISGFLVRKSKVRSFEIDNKKAAGAAAKIAQIAAIYTLSVPLLDQLITNLPISSPVSTNPGDRLRPIVDAIKSCARPICLGSMLWGFSKVMLGQKHEGYRQVWSAIWGYVGIQFVPFIMDVVDGIGRQQV